MPDARCTLTRQHETSFRQLKDFWHPVGCIAIGAEGRNRLTSKVFGKTPVVWLDRTPLTKGASLDVVQDYAEGGEQAARELICPEIAHYAFVGFREPSSWSDLRGRAFERVVRLHGKIFHAFGEYQTNPSRPALLDQFLRQLPKPIGVFAANDRTAQEVHMICKRNGIRIPQDLLLLGIDNIADICETADPKISSISTDFELAGWMCGDLLLERLANPRLKNAVRKYRTLGVVRRATTRRMHGYDAQILRIVNLIRARACEDLTVEDVAADMGCSRRMAEIRFLSATGKTIKETITEVRLDRAKVLLQGRELSLDSVAATCGYASVTALRIAFKKRFGKPLTFFRSEGRSASKRR